MNAGDPLDYLYESRPAIRNKNAIYGQLRHYFNGNSMDVSYRYFWDDWGVVAHTVDANYLWQAKNGRTYQPHVRWYRQSSSNIYAPFLVQGANWSKYASSDSRLAAFTALTFCLEYSRPIKEDSRLSITGEYYTQFGDRSPPGAFGSLSGLEMFPRLKAVMVRVGFEHDF